MIDWSDVSDTYADAVRSVFPAERLAIAALGVLGTVAVRSQQYKSVVESILRQPIASVNMSPGSPFASLSMADVAIALALVGAAVLVSYLAKRFVFHLAARSTSLESRMNSFARGLAARDRVSLDQVKSVLDITDRVLVNPKRRLRSLHAAAELSAGLAVGALVASTWGNVLDVAVGAVSAAAVLGIHVMATRTFLAQYLGPSLFRAAVLGQPLPSTSKLDR